MKRRRDFSKLEGLLRKIPGISGRIGHGLFESGNWWVKFQVDINHENAWRIVQEFGHVLNYLSLDEQLPTVFKPVSPPPYLNGGPTEYLSWVIESTDPEFTPTNATKWLISRLPDPVDDQNEWTLE